MATARSGRQPSIGDVARLAGVSVTTVSRVINGSSKVSDRRRTRILAAIEEIGYRPNGAARALVSGRLQTIGVLTGDTTGYGSAATIRGIEEAARRRNMMVTITVIESDDPAHIRSAVDLVLGQPLAGVVGIEFDRRVSLAVEHLPSRLPAASASLTGTHFSGLPRAFIDDELAARLATAHLLDQGHSTVHHLGVEEPAPGDRGRSHGWLRTLRERDIPAPPIVVTEWTPAAAHRVTLEAIGDDVTALFCFNDEIAMGAMRALTDLGRAVPGDVSVIGFDDMPLAGVWTPALSSVRMDFAGLGRAAFELVSTLIDGGEAPADIELASELVIRESVGAPRHRLRQV